MRAESEGKTGSPSQIHRSTKNPADSIAKPADGKGTALSQALVSLELDMAIRRALSWMFEPAIRWLHLLLLAWRPEYQVVEGQARDR